MLQNHIEEIFEGQTFNKWFYFTSMAPLVFGHWLLFPGPWSVVSGPWSLVLGSWFFGPSVLGPLVLCSVGPLVLVPFWFLGSPSRLSQSGSQRSVFLLAPFSVFRFCTPFGSFWLFVCGFIGPVPPSLRSEPVFVPPFWVFLWGFSLISYFPWMRPCLYFSKRFEYNKPFVVQNRSIRKGV